MTLTSEHAFQIYRSKVIWFKSYCPKKHKHRHTRPISLNDVGSKLLRCKRSLARVAASRARVKTGLVRGIAAYITGRLRHITAMPERRPDNTQILYKHVTGALPVTWVVVKWAHDHGSWVHTRGRRLGKTRRLLAKSGLTRNSRRLSQYSLQLRQSWQTN